MRKKIVWLVVIILILAVAVFLFFKLKPAGWEWYDENVKNQYQEMVWQTGEVSPLAGIPVQYQAKEMRAEKCASREEREKNDYLRVEGGMCAMPVKLFIKDEKGQEKNVGGKDGLVQLLGKIDTPEKALSLVVLTTGDIKRTANSLVVLRNTKVEGGYLVEYISNNTFGCGTHQPLKMVVLVLENGEIKLVAAEKEKPSLEPEVCVD